MQYRTNPKNGQALSALGFGCMRFTRKGGGIDQAKANRELSLALEKGVNYFDTAYIYPGSEVCLGNFLREYGCRDRVYIATKLPHYRVNAIADAERFFQEELQRLGTDHVDYYLMHMLNDAASWEQLTALGMREWIAEKKQSGAIRSIGFSFHGGALAFKKLLDAYDWEFCQIQFNYMDEFAQAGTGGLEYAHAKGLPVIIMEPLRGGKLAGGLPEKAKRIFAEADPRRTPVDWALRWLWDHEAVTVVLSGMNDVHQVEENCLTAEDSRPGALTDAEKAVYARALEVIQTGTRVGCTGCGYCQPCPKGVDIPGCFAAYNASYADGYVNALREYMMCTTLRSARSNAGLCVKCGKCERHCPQSLPIREELDKVRRRFETPLYRLAAAIVPKIMKY